MKKHLLAALLLSCLPLSAQDIVSSAEAQAELPAWLVNFSNLPKERREEFALIFNEAKQDYQRKDWSGCMERLTACDIIFADNPNTKVLRVGCMQELGLYDQALSIILEHLKTNPSDLVAQFNLSSIYMGLKEYQKCAEVLAPLIINMSMEDDAKFRDVLNYRLFICKLLLNEESSAMATVKNCSIMDDSPLYYMVQVALNLHTGDRNEASKNLKIAQKIYGKSMNMPAYERCLEMTPWLSKWDIAL